MDNDDQPIGRILGRREALKILGAAGAALAEGPYFVDEQLNRSEPAGSSSCAAIK